MTELKSQNDMIERLRLDMEKILRDKERIGRQDKS
jgi:hypothetical protein